MTAQGDQGRGGLRAELGTGAGGPPRAAHAVPGFREQGVEGAYSAGGAGSSPQPPWRTPGWALSGSGVGEGRAPRY